MPEHVVNAGECITSIADQYGFFWQTLWDHPQNAELKDRRQDPNVLLPGDVVFVPELRERWESGDDANRHRFRKRGVPGVLRLRLMREPEPEAREETQYPPPDDVNSEDPRPETQSVEDEPRADVEVTVEIEGRLTQMRTDSEGRIEVQIPPRARRGRLIVEPGTERESAVELAMGHLNPISVISGVRQRLANLGFSPGTESEEETLAFVAAVREFQRRRGMEATGELTDETRQAIQEAHGD